MACRRRDASRPGRPCSRTRCSSSWSTESRYDAGWPACRTSSAPLEARRQAVVAALVAAEAAVDEELDPPGGRPSRGSRLGPGRLLATYDRLRARVDGVAVARLVGSHCDGCHLTLPAMELDRHPPSAAGRGRHLRAVRAHPGALTAGGSPVAASARGSHVWRAHATIGRRWSRQGGPVDVGSVGRKGRPEHRLHTSLAELMRSATREPSPRCRSATTGTTSPARACR